MHGISRETLEKEGESASKVVGELVTCLGGSNGVIYSDAAHWDSGWMDTLFIAAKVLRHLHVGSIYGLLEKDQILRFDKAKARLAESGKYRHHRAKEDVRMIYEAYVEVSC
ncbi:MAG: hypothetical protein GXP08_00785 [Gammaproteobacteria bacterium]|nr:hypothetical protein [Gammaproteobacteria bacterium]